MGDMRMNITVPLELYRELKWLSLLHERSVPELKAELSDQERLHEQIVEESRAIRAR